MKKKNKNFWHDLKYCFANGPESTYIFTSLSQPWSSVNTSNICFIT